MPEILAIGPTETERLQHTLRDGEVLRLGRAPDAGWAIPWELGISREHADLAWRDGTLTVHVLQTARNPFVYRDRQLRQFTLSVGEQFHLGTTRFELAESQKAASEQPFDENSGSGFQERAFGPDALHTFEFGNAAVRLELLSTLPQAIAGSRDDEDLAVRLVELLLQAIPQADAAAVLAFDIEPAGDSTAPGRAGRTHELPDNKPPDNKSPDNKPPDNGAGLPHLGEKPAMMRWTCRRDVGRFRPSRHLVGAALQRGESLLHMWTGGDSQFTMSGDLDWAFCVPFSQESCRGWALYVSGKFGMTVLAAGSPEESLKGHMRFAELVAQFIGAIRQVRALQNRHDTMRRFFSPAVVNTLSDKRLESALAPREGLVSVLFCDVRGFSQHVERARDHLHEVLARISEALGVMTRSVMAQQGVIADFQGDAVLAFWGWPTRLDDGPLAACRAALAIHQKFIRAANEPGNLLAGFQVGIGIGHGPAIAGQIGTDDQVKIGVFGPVVNLTSRLDGISRQFGVMIVIDEATAEFVRHHMPPSESRCRRLGRVRPKGMADAVLVSELLPSAGPELYSSAHLEAHETAVDAFMRGDWLQAKAILGKQTAPDGAKDFLLAFMSGHGFTPPPGWDGVLALSEK